MKLRAVCVMTTCLGAYAPTSWATCTTTGTTITCLGSTTTTAGSGATTSNYTINIGDPTGPTAAQLPDGDQPGISVEDGNTINIVAGSTVSNAAVSSNGNFGKGGNTIEFRNNNTLTIGVGASVQSNGTETSAEAINPLGTGNTIINNGSITAKNAAAIWFDGGGPNTVINNGVLSGKGQAINLSTGALTFENQSLGVVTGTIAGGTGSVFTNDTGGVINNAVTLGSASTFTNNGKMLSTLSAGAGSSVTLGASSTIGAITITGAGNTLSVDSSATYGALTLSGTTNKLVLTGTTSANWSSSMSTFSQITKTGTGIWTLVPTAAPPATATIEAAAGTLVLGAASLATVTSMTVDSGATLQGPGSDMSATVVNNGFVDFTETAGSTYAGTVSGTGSIRKDGTGTLTLSHSNSFTGATTIAGGTVVASAANALGSTSSIDVMNGTTLRTDAAGAIGSTTSMQVDGTFNLNNTNQSVGTLSGSGTVSLGSASLTTQSNTDSTFSGVVSGTGTLSKSGTGTLSLTGTNTYTGLTTIAAGALQIGNGGTSGSLAGNVADSGSLIFNRSDTSTYSGTVTGTGNVVQAGTGTTILTGSDAVTGTTTVSAGTLQVGNGGTTGSITGNVTDNATLAFNRSDTSTYAGNITGSGNVVQNGTGTTILTGADAVTSSTTVSAGTLQVGNGGTTGSISGDVTNNATLSFNRSDTSTYGGNITGSGTVVQAGTGTTILTGTDAVTGSTTISAGTLQIGNGGTSGAVSGDIADNSALVFNRADTSVYAGSITGSGSVSQAGTGTTILTGTDAVTGTTTVSAGTLQVGNGGTSGAIAGDVVNNATLTFNRSDTSTYSGTITGTGNVVQAGTGTTVLTGSDAVTGTTTISAGTLQVGNGGTTGSISGNIVDNATLAFNRSDSTTYSGTVSGSGGLVQSGTGTLALSANNSYTGVTTIASGTLALGIGGSSGSVAGDIVNNAAMILNRNDTWTYGGTISGSGTLTQAGPGTTVLTAENTYTGTTTISAGTLQLGNGGTTGDVGGNIDNNGALVFDRSDAHVVSNAISGSGSVTQAGTGTTALTADNTYTGTTTIAAGSTLQLGNGGATGSVASTIANSGSLVFDRSDMYTFSPTISGGGDVTQAGSGTLVFNTAQLYTGTTHVDAGTLQVDSTLASPSTVVAAGATLTGRGTLAGSVINSGTVSPGDPSVLPSLAASSASPSALAILGNYSGNNARIAIRSVLNAGGTGNQTTDRLLIAGTLSGTNTLVVTPLAGSIGAVTGNLATDGISVVQANGGIAASALTLAGGYVAGGPYQFRLYTYGPAQTSAANIDPALAAAGVAGYTDFRLQTVTVLSGSDPSAPVGTGPNGEAPGTPLVVPQVPAYQALPTGAIAYGLALADEWHKRVGDLAPASEDDIEGDSPELFTRAKDWRANISKGDQASYDQHLWFAQTGAGAVMPSVFASGDRLNVDLMLSQGGSTSQVVVNQASTHFDATSVGVASTYRTPGGAYVDGVVEGVFYNDVTFNTQQRGHVGDTVGRAEIASLEAGVPLQADASTTFEPRASLTFQHVGFNSMVDVDGVMTDPGSSNSLVSDIGLRIRHRIDFSAAGKSYALEPFVSIDYTNELLGGNRITAGGIDFASAGAGHFIRVGGGVSVRVGPSVGAYLGFEHDMSVAKSSPTGNEFVATLNMRF